MIREIANTIFNRDKDKELMETYKDIILLFKKTSCMGHSCYSGCPITPELCKEIVKLGDKIEEGL